jgi:cell division protein FtsB
MDDAMRTRNVTNDRTRRRMQTIKAAIIQNRQDRANKQGQVKQLQKEIADHDIDIKLLEDERQLIEYARLKKHYKS